MSLRSLSTVLLSVIISVCASLWLSLRWRQPGGSRLQATGIDIVDGRHRVRCTIVMVEGPGVQVPQIVLRDEKGQDSATLTLNERGEGTLFFSSQDLEGKVGIGYLSGTDVVTGSGAEITDEKNSNGSWGVRVLGQGPHSTGLGFRNDGTVIGPSH